MILSTAAILVFLFIFTGVGLLFPRPVFHKDPRFHNLLIAFWTGWALAIGFLQLWHLLFPVGAAACAVITAAGAAGWLRSRKVIVPYIKSLNLRAALLWSALAVIPAAALANHVMFVPPHWDHGLYHMQTVKWISSYAIVPGLGNLHHRLAFNNANFLYAAMLNWGPLEGRSYFIAGPLLVYGLVLMCANGFIQLLRRGDLQAHHLYYALMIPVVLDWATTTHLPGYSPDVVVFVLQVVLGGELLRLVECGADREYFQRLALAMALMAAAGISVKLSFAVFGALILLAVLALGALKFRFDLRQDAGFWLRWAGLAALLVLPWLARHVILSGYPLFPYWKISLPVAWKMPEDLVAPIAPVITNWAQTASNSIPYTGDWEWFMNWFRRFPFVVKQSFFFTLLIAALNFGLFLKLRRKTAFDWGPLALFVISSVSLVYWFLLGPDYRFSGATFWTLLVSAVVFGFHLLTANQGNAQAVRLAVSVLLVLTIWLSPNQFSNNLSRSLLLAPQPETILAEQALSQSAVESKLTTSGLEVYMPPETTDQCWNAPLPCMPPHDFTPRLRLIEPEDMGKGFWMDWD